MQWFADAPFPRAYHCPTKTSHPKAPEPKAAAAVAICRAKESGLNQITVTAQPAVGETKRLAFYFLSWRIRRWWLLRPRATNAVISLELSYPNSEAKMRAALPHWSISETSGD